LLEASWIPPVRLNGAKANLGAVALGRGFALRQRGTTTVGIRVHATFGVVEAPITCDDEALVDVTSECYRGTRSDDRGRESHPGCGVWWGDLGDCARLSGLAGRSTRLPPML
jgi:hypothetical protein